MSICLGLRNISFIVCVTVLGCAQHTQVRRAGYDVVATDVRAFRAEVRRLHDSARRPIFTCEVEDYGCEEEEMMWTNIGAASTQAEAAIDAYWLGRGTRAQCVGAIDVLRHMYAVVLREKRIVKPHESKARRN